MEALDFGKYNFYIWASYGITFVVLVWNITIPLLQKKKLLKNIKRRNYLNSNGSNETNSENTNENVQ
ncbi:MAG TPA: heme exporter protein CcmD [Gammaproteobacteria bacterium]|nr:heme exporter protein CcmD [Gammaproteobacteria bacterium]